MGSSTMNNRFIKAEFKRISPSLRGGDKKFYMVTFNAKNPRTDRPVLRFMFCYKNFLSPFSWHRNKNGGYTQWNFLCFGGWFRGLEQ